MKKSALSRRNFLKNSGVVSLGFVGLQTYLMTMVESCEEYYTPTKGNYLKNRYGKLKRDPNGILNLPDGFKYKIIARRGQPMSDGLVHPDKPDGMSTFVGKNGRVILIRNHELMPTNYSAFGKDYELIDKVESSKMYDMRNGYLPCCGGTTTLVVNENTLEVEKSWLSLGGTLRNCAGGPTPWGSWLSCEEIVIPANNKYENGHGYNFEVPASETIGMVEPHPLKDMGQFNHEAVCVDPRTGIVYQTEDRDDSLIYRFVPHTPGDLAKGGKLQALGLKGTKNVSARNWQEDNGTFPINQQTDVEWIDLGKVDEVPNDDLRRRGYLSGAVMFARGEGMWFGNNEVYFACTSGGYTKTGQIFRYIPSPKEGTKDEKDEPGKVELFLEPNNTQLLRHCDNLTVSPWGDIVFCEDNERPRAVGVTKEGQFYQIAQNVRYKSEFAGGVFSPSGKTYFVNIQHAGLTVAIQGPWGKRAAGETAVLGA
ncbi:MAG: alkaline phosphatase PhoX [Bacteroidota bacterium]